MINSKWLLTNAIVLLFLSFTALAGTCLICSEEGHDAVNCPKKNRQPDTGASPSTGIDISDLPRIPGSGASVGGLALTTGDGLIPLMQGVSLTFQEAGASQADPINELAACHLWLSCISENAPRVSVPGDNEVTAPVLDDELANAQQGHGYSHIQQGQNQAVASFLNEYLAFSSTQYLIHYQMFDNGSEVLSQVILLEIDIHGHLYVLSDTYGVWNTITHIGSVEDFIRNTFGAIEDGDAINLYLHHPEPEENNEGTLTPTNLGSLTPGDDDDRDTKTSTYQQ